MTCSLPNWVGTLAEPDQAVAKQRFLLRFAALHASPAGTLGALSRAIGRSKNALTPHVTSPYVPVSVEMALALETTVGRDVLPREMLRPDIFCV